MGMKKVILTFTLLLFTYVFQSCNNDKKSTVVEVDYASETSYKIENQSDKLITIVRVYGHSANAEVFSETLSIASGMKKEIYSEREICGENTIVTEFEGETLPILLNNDSVEIYVDGLLINEDLLKNKDNWSFTADGYYYATYLLVLTDELIEMVGYSKD